MTSKRIGIIAAGAMAGALLLGTAGLVAAGDPNATPGGPSGAGMMGASGMTMTTAQLAQMSALHDQMAASGTCTQAQMQQLHAQHHPSN